MSKVLKGIRVLGTGGLACFFAFAVPGAGLAASPAPNPVDEAVDHVRNLEYDEAREQLEAWLKDHPQDLRALNALASAILQKEMFRRDLLENRVYASGGEAFRDDKPAIAVQFKEQLFGVLDKIESLAQERLKNNPQDELALYWLGSAHATRAIYLVAIAKEKFDALGEAKEARNDHARVLALNPSFVDAMLLVGIYDYIVGSLPWYMKFVATIAGYRGNKERGLASMERVAREGNLAKAEAQQFLAIFYYREKRYPETLTLLRDMARHYPRNFIIPQEIARTYKAQEDWRKAAETYDRLLAQYRAGARGYGKMPVTKILFQAGEVHAKLGETDQALRLFDEAAGGEEDNIFVYRAELAAGGVYQQQNRFADARRRYERVAKAVPATEEGKAARQYLRQLPSPSAPRAQGS